MAGASEPLDAGGAAAATWTIDGGGEVSGVELQPDQRRVWLDTDDLPEPGTWTLRVGDRTFSIDLRKRSWQLPFRVHLRDFTRELHPGTSIPASFYSEVSCMDGAVLQDVRISMNAPLRRDGYTLYQAGWGPQDAPPGTPLFSTFAVVHNPVDRLPLIACIVIALGLLIHFSPKLTRHIRVQAART